MATGSVSGSGVEGVRDDASPVGGGRLPAVAAVVGAALIWSTSFVATKALFVEIPPLTVGALRFGVAAGLIVVLAGVTGALRGPGLADAGRLGLGGILGITLYFSLENYGLKLATASDAALLVASYPAITMLLQFVLFRSRVPLVRLLGVGLAMIGVYLVVRAGADAAGPSRLIGDLILVATGVVWAFYNFITRGVVRKYPLVTVLAYQTVAGTVAFVPLAFLEAERWRPVGIGSWLVVAYLGVFCSLVAFFLYARGLRSLDAGSAVGLMNLVPVFGVVSAVVLLEEPVGFAQVLGGLIVIGGVMLSIRDTPKPEKTKTRR